MAGKENSAGKIGKLELFVKQDKRLAGHKDEHHHYIDLYTVHRKEGTVK